MTEIDAIKNLKAYMYYAFDELPEDVGKAISVALAALREKAEREKGCEVCNNKYSEQLGAKQYAVTLKYYEVGDGGYHYIKPRFCPMCGRELEEHHEAN